MKKFILSTLLTVLAITAYGQNIDQVYTRDGSQYEGFICEQIPGETLSVYAEKAVIIVPSNTIKEYREDYRQFKDLTPVAQDWFREFGDTTVVALASFESNGKYYDDVYIKSKNGVNTSIIAFNRKTYKLDWNTIVKTTKTHPEEYIPYGICDVVTLKSGEQFKGAIVEQIIGESLTIVDEDGVRNKIAVGEILSTRVEKISGTCDIWAQAQLLDRIQVDGKRNVEGIIVSRILGQKLNILLKNGSYEESYDLAEVSRYQKFNNVSYEEYVPPVAVVDTAKVVLVNGKERKFSPVVEFNGMNFVVPSDTTVVTNGSTVKLIVNNIECDKTASLYATSSIKYKDKNGNGQAKYRKAYPAFPKNDWAVYECSINPEGNRVVVECKIKKKGMYFLSFTKETGKGIVIKAE